MTLLYAYGKNRFSYDAALLFKITFLHAMHFVKVKYGVIFSFIIYYDILKESIQNKKYVSQIMRKNEPRHEKTNVLHMRKQRRRSASR